MLGILANYHNAALALDDLALLAHGLNRGSDFHCVKPPTSLLASPGDAAAGQIIRSHLNSDLIAGEYLNIVHPELAGNVSQDGMATADINLEHGIGQRFNNSALKFDHIIFCQD